jgi:hypothetical protein
MLGEFGICQAVHKVVMLSEQQNLGTRTSLSSCPACVALKQGDAFSPCFVTLLQNMP